MNARGLLMIALLCVACGSKRASLPASLAIELRPARVLWYAAPPGMTDWPVTLTGPKVRDPGLVIGLNNDDSDLAGGSDASDNKVNGPVDLSQMTQLVIKQRAASAGSSDKLHVARKPGAGHVRVFRFDAFASAIFDSQSTTPMQDADATALMNDTGAADVALLVEGTAAGDVELCVKWTGGSTVEQCAKLFVVDGYGAAAGFGPRIYGDTNRDGNLTAATDLPGHDAYTGAAGAIVFVNIDKDCGVPPDDQSDTTIACGPDELDIAQLRIDKARAPLTGAPADWKPVLRYVDSALSKFRLFGGTATGAAEIVGDEVMLAGVKYRRFDLSSFSPWIGATGELALGLEGRVIDDGTFEVYHCLTHIPTDTDAACDKLVFQTSPAMLQPNTERDARVVVLDDAANLEMRTKMAASMPAAVTLQPVTVTGSTDPWFQDQVEITGLSGPRGNAQLVLDLPRSKNLNAWAATLIDAGLARLDLSAAGTTDSPQFGGNIECSPKGAGSDGRIVVGDDMEAGLVSELEKKARRQLPIEKISVSWLWVGHVDEVAAFFPRTGNSWGTTVASPDLARSLLAPLDAHASLGWHCRTPDRSRAPECFGHGSVTSATDKVGSTPAKLTASGFDFTTRPAGREFQFIRIYDGKGRGQMAHISARTAHSVSLDVVAITPTVEWNRCAGSAFEPDQCDPALPMPAATPDVQKDTWWETPDTTSRFVVVEDSVLWESTLPALYTAGELRDTTLNAAFWANQALVEVEMASVRSKLNALPGGTTPVKVPVLYRVFSSGGTLTSRSADSLLPAIVNYQVVNGTSGTKIFAPRQFGPSTGGADPFEEAFRTALTAASAAGPVVFVDDWYLYHLGVGDVHCGTNLFKQSARSFWLP